ncbi:hypothetical protein V8G54_026344 [Vigna mungo]|uniref:Rad21/Rec8-like protein N-terminal domain-containing protein n=1 Tax=Vigna mungo TaxID=3915 RepID=A0AAQ3N0M6_VIGMU
MRPFQQNWKLRIARILWQDPRHYTVPNVVSRHFSFAFNHFTNPTKPNIPSSIFPNPSPIKHLKNVTMFYSQTFLARKGPLSTVWIAAHLQHRLKKSHYTTTDIPSTVLRIMDPGVPIALRMSGHLLLGVVRIYSKKVEYLHQDCKDALTGLHKAFSSLQFAQTEEVGPAPFQSGLDIHCSPVSIIIERRGCCR